MTWAIALQKPIFWVLIRNVFGCPLMVHVCGDLSSAGLERLPVTQEAAGSSPIAPANSSEQQCMQCHNVAAQITPGVSVIHAIVDKPSTSRLVVPNPFGIGSGNQLRLERGGFA